MRECFPLVQIKTMFKYVKHKNPKYLVYGYQFGETFQQHKWTEVNQHMHTPEIKKAKKLKPHICCEHIFTNKEMGKDFWETFVEISLNEYDVLFKKDYFNTYP